MNIWNCAYCNKSHTSVSDMLSHITVEHDNKLIKKK